MLVSLTSLDHPGSRWQHSLTSHTDNIIIIKLYCHIHRALHDELERSMALTHIVPIYTIKLNMANKYKIYIVHNLFFKMKKKKFNIIIKTKLKIIDYLFNNNCGVN